VSCSKHGKPSLEVAAVPEISVAEDQDSLLDEHDFGAARQAGMVESITAASSSSSSSSKFMAIYDPIISVPKMFKKLGHARSGRERAPARPPWQGMP